MLRNVYGTVLAVNRLFSNNTVSLYPELNELSIYALIEGVISGINIT
jgi:hypothetical protein